MHLVSESNGNWAALSSEDWHSSDHPDATISQDANQVSIIEQDSDETIIVRDSCEVIIQTTDTQAAVSLQVALQLALALVLSITIGDSDRSRAVVQDMVQYLQVNQRNKQKIIIENSRKVTIITTDTDISVNIQALLQVLVALVVKVDIL
ncbi:spore coat protein [Bacillus sp. DJP31]|uniref:spore coat protein n=1 Tax=Bacillus sp. DJP31 TaxID=3409789 RepID=UPI003BB79BD0